MKLIVDFNSTTDREKWENIIEFPDRQISNLGRVKGKRGAIMRLNKTNSGYPIIGMSNRAFTVHRLVARAFIPNPENKPFVNHINGNKNDNRAVNLEWCTGSENMRHAFDTGIMDNCKEKARERMKVIGVEYGKIRGKKIIVIDSMGNETVFKSRRLMQSVLKIDRKMVREAIKYNKPYKGYTFK